MDEFTSYLLSGKSHAKISPESLELMGKEAASIYLKEGVPLNTSIAKIASEHDNISTEQIKRIVEFANTAVYLAKHDQDKTAGAESSYPQFDLADSSQVLKDLSIQARPEIRTSTDIDYDRSVVKLKISSAKTEAALEELFKSANGDEKDYSKETIVHEVMSAKETLTSMRDNLVDRFNQQESLFKEATAEFYDNLKRHLLEGGSFGEAYAAVKSIVGEDSNSILEPFVGRLIQEKVSSVSQLKKQLAEGEKFAGVVDSSHPMVQSLSAMVLSGEDLRSTSLALDEVGSELDDVNAFIKNAFAPAVMAAGRGLATAASGLLRSKTVGGSLARGALGEMRKNPVSTAATVASMIPKKQPAPVPPTNFGG